MLRKGVPPALRCAIWVSNVMRACHPDASRDPSHPHYYEEYRTLGKVRYIDTAWEAVITQIFPDESDRRDALRPTFGNEDAHFTKYLPPFKKPLALAHVLNALEHILGLDFCPLLPPLTAIMLRYMSESYVYLSLREMAQHSSWYFPVTQVEQYAWCQTFSAVIQRLHPQTAAAMKQNGTLTPKGLEPIFKHFFLPILREEHVTRLLDVYTLEGAKIMFRFSVAICCLFKKERKDMDLYTPEQWWRQMREYAHSPTFDFEVVMKKAYGYHGKAVRERKRFPNRQILSRMIKLEEEKALDVEFDIIEKVPRAVGLMDPQHNPNNKNIVLAKDAQRRSHIAKWLPVSLQLTKLDLIYSSNIHGRAMERFYSNVKGTKQTLTILECLDNDCVIGMFASHAWKVSNEIYGDGECFLFRLDPQPECWKWKPDEQLSRPISPILLDTASTITGDGYDSSDHEEANELRKRSSLLEQFMVGRDTFISMGGNESGTCGLRLNEDLTKGESATAKGYNNDPLPFLRNFEVGLVEVYRLVRAVDGKTADQFSAEQFVKSTTTTNSVARSVNRSR